MSVHDVSNISSIPSRGTDFFTFEVFSVILNGRLHIFQYFIPLLKHLHNVSVQLN